jgi:membrane-associated phospholipid phosphatase
VKYHFFFILALLFVHTSQGQSLDYKILKKINVDIRPANLDNEFKFISNTTAIVAIGTPVSLLATAWATNDKKLMLLGEEAAFSFGITTVLAQALKASIHRNRPFVDHPDIIKLTSGGGYSFPSGHTSDAFALAFTMAYHTKKWYIIAPAFAWAGLVGYSRMDLGVHYPSDVLGGVAVGFISAYTARKLNKWLHQEKHPAKTAVLF